MPYGDGVQLQSVGKRGYGIRHHAEPTTMASDSDSFAGPTSAAHPARDPGMLIVGPLLVETPTLLRLRANLAPLRLWSVMA